MSKINTLLLDAGFSAVPILQAAQYLGYQCGVCSSKVVDPGHILARKSFVMDYSDYSVVEELVKQEGVIALLPGVTDVSYQTGARIAEKIGLPGFDSFDTAQILFKKDLFRAYAKKKGFPVPKAVKRISDVGDLQYPLLVKPSDAYSGRGIVKVEDHRDVNNAYATAVAESLSGDVVIEEFIEGSLHSHSAFIRNGVIACEFFVDEYCSVYPYQVNSSCVSTCLDDAMMDDVSTCIQELVTDLSLCDGILHTQFISNGNAFWLIELTRRCPGDLYSQLIQLTTDIPYSTLFTAPFLGVDIPIDTKRFPRKRNIARHTVSTSQSSIFISLNYNSSPCKIIDVVPLKKSGESLQEAPFDRAAIIFSEFENLSEMQKKTPNLNEYFTVKHVLEGNIHE